MEWQNFVDWLKGVTENPAFISIVSILCVGAFALIGLSKTSVGKAAITKITSLCSENTRRVEEYWNNTKNVYKKVEETKNQIEAFKSDCVDRIKVAFGQFEFFENSIYAIIEEIPNAKVQAKLVEFKNNWESKKREIEKTVGITYSGIENLIKETENKYVGEIADLRGELDELKEFIKANEKTKENVENGERNEGTDNKTEEK